VYKGQKEKIKAAADAVGLSVNAYISKAIALQMEQDGTRRLYKYISMYRINSN